MWNVTETILIILQAVLKRAKIDFKICSSSIFSYELQSLKILLTMIFLEIKFYVGGVGLKKVPLTPKELLITTVSAA
jgi:hypothetical protein